LQNNENSEFPINQDFESAQNHQNKIDEIHNPRNSLSKNFKNYNKRFSVGPTNQSKEKPASSGNPSL